MFFQITAKILRRRTTQEGEIYQDMQMFKVEPNTTHEPCIFFVWPLEVVHVIDQNSPFYQVSATDLVHEKFELLAIMEGTSETSSMTFQAK
jgi:potassium inwardly-rectifying channel subfamily J